MIDSTIQYIINVYTEFLNWIRKNWKIECSLLIGSIIVVIFYSIRLHFFSNPLIFGNDNLAIGYPERVIVSSSIQSGIFPLWDHWTHGGRPFNNPLVPLAFSPIVLLLSLFGVYSTSVYEIEILIIHILGFIGMYIWLRFYSSKLSALIIAFCFTLTGAQIIQTPINSEFFISISLLPWIGVGLKYCLSGISKGIAILAFAFWIMMTTGYLGLNALCIELICLYCAVEAIALTIINKGKNNKLTIRGFSFIICGFLLGFLIINFPFIENYAHFGTSFYTVRNTSFSSYTVSARLSSLFTLFFPNAISPFVPDNYSAHTGIMFFGSIPIYMIIYSFFRKKIKFKISLLILFSILSFVLMVSAKYDFAKLLTLYFPLIRYVRWHASFLPISVFFLATISSVGMKAFLEDRQTKLKLKVYILFITLAISVLLLQSSLMTIFIVEYLFYPQIFTYIILGLIIVISHKKTSLLICLLAIVEVIIVSFSIVLLKTTTPYTGVVKEEVLKSEIIKNSTKNFPIISNQRSTTDLHYNPQYFTKQPTLYGYSPIIHPYITSIINDPQYPSIMKYLFYSTSSLDMPKISGDLKVLSVRLTPNSAKATINNQGKELNIVWSSPYSSFWKLSVDGVPTPTYPNKFKLTQFAIEHGVHSISFIYVPPYLIASFLISVISIGVSIFLLCKKST